MARRRPEKGTLPRRDDAAIVTGDGRGLGLDVSRGQLPPRRRRPGCAPLPALFFLIPLIPVVLLVRPARLAWQRAFVAPRALSNEPWFVTVLRMLLAGRSIATGEFGAGTS